MILIMAPRYFSTHKKVVNVWAVVLLQPCFSILCKVLYVLHTRIGFIHSSNLKLKLFLFLLNVHFDHICPSELRLGGPRDISQYATLHTSVRRWQCMVIGIKVSGIRSQCQSQFMSTLLALWPLTNI